MADKKLWLVTHEHRFGHTTWPFYSNEVPDDDDIVRMFDIDYEPDREDEHLVVEDPGPIDDMDEWKKKQRPTIVIGPGELRRLCTAMDAYQERMEKNDDTVTARVDMYHYDNENIYLSIEEDLTPGKFPDHNDMEKRTAQISRSTLMESHNLEHILSHIKDN